MHVYVFITFKPVYYFVFMMWQTTKGESAMDITQSIRTLPGSILSHNGADQPTHTQVHERRHGAAITGQCQETTR